MNQKLFSEFIATFIMVFVGCGAIVVDTINSGVIGSVGISLVFGFVVSSMIYTFGHISGSHMNPAVTIAFAVIDEFDKKDVLKYILAQLFGAILASLILLFLFFENVTSMKEMAYLGATLPKGSWYQAFILEYILSFILMIVICGSAVHAKAIKSFAGLSIGLTITFEALFGGAISGASMNPVRSLAPALVSGHFESLWIYIMATILGATSGSIVYKYIIKCKNSDECLI